MQDASSHPQRAGPASHRLACEALPARDGCRDERQEPATFLGRVCCDAEGRLNDQSVMLEGGIAESAGARVRLDLSQVRRVIARLRTGSGSAPGVRERGHR